MVEAASGIIFALFVASEITYWRLYWQKTAAVHGSYEHYVLCLKAALAAAAMMVSGVSFGIILISFGEYAAGVILGALSIGCILLIKAHLDEADWIDGQKRRLKHRLRRLRGRIRSTPALQPLPAAI